MTSPLGGGTVFRLATGVVDVAANTTGLRRELQTGVARESAGSKIVLPVELDRNFHRKIKTELQSALKNLPTITIDANSTPAEREIARIRAELEDLEQKDIGIDVDAEVALQKITELRRQLNDLATNSPDIKVKAQTATASADLARIEQQAARIRDESVKIDVETHYDKGKLRDTAASAGTSAAGSFASAFSGSMPNISGSVVAIAAIGAAAIPASAAVLALGSSLGLAASSAAALAPAMLGAAAGIGAIMLATRGAIEAVKLHGQEQQQAAARAAASAAAQSAAAKRIQSAQDSLADARRNQARAAADGAERIEAAEGRLAAAQERHRDTQDALTRARERATEQLIDLRDAAAGAILGEEAAEVALLRARERQAKISTDALSDSLDYREAALDVARAEQNLAEAKRANTQAQDDYNDATRKGVEGSDLVVDAKDRERDAAKSVADAQRDLAKTQADAAERQEQAAIQVSRAVSSLADAQREAAEATRQAAGGASRYQQALAKLSPAGREFVETLIGMRSTIDGFKRTAEGAVLPGFTSALNSFKVLAPDINQYIGAIGSQVGRAAAELGKFMESGMFRGQLKNIMAENEKAASSFANSTVPIASILTTISEAAAPLVSRFAEAWENGAKMIANWLDAKRESGELAAFFKAAGDEMSKWWSILKNFTVGIIGLFAAASPAGQDLSDKLKSISERFREWATSQETRDKIQRFFEWITSEETRANVRDLAAGIASAGLAMKGMGIASGVAQTLLSMGPAGLVIGAIAAAAAAAAFAFGYLYSNSETFRSSVDEIVASIKTNLGPVFEWFHTFISEKIVPKLREWLIPAFNDVKGIIVDHLLPAIKEMYERYMPQLEAAWDRIVGALNDNKGSFETLWSVIKTVGTWVIDNLIPILGSLGGFIAGYLSTAISVGINIVGGIVSAFKTMWEVGTWVFEGIKTVVTTVMGAITGAIGFALDIIKQVWGIAFNWIDQLTGGKLTAIKATVEDILGKVKKFIGDAIGGIKGFFSDMWTVVKEGWSTGWGWLKEKGEKFIGGIKDAVGGIKDKFVETIRGIPRAIVGGLNAVLDMVNKIIGKVNGFLPGGMKIPTIEGRIVVPEGYATGGRIVGPGTGTSDSVPILASNGEYMIRAGAVRALSSTYGPNFLDQLNRFDIGGDPSTMTLRRGYADGGLISRTQAAIRNADPLPYVWGAVGPSAYDCSGLVGQVWAMLTGHPSFRRYFTTANVATGGFGFKPGHGTYTIGLSPSHVVGNLAGLAFEAASSRSGIKVGSSAKSVDAMPRQYYLPQVGGEFVSGGGGKNGGTDLLGDIRNAITSMASDLVGKIPRPGGFIDNVISGVWDKAISGLKGLNPFGSSGQTGSAVGGALTTAMNVETGRRLAAERGWTGGQWSALYQLWQHESGWNHLAKNRSSGAYGIPQALPASKMASAGGDYLTSPATQIRWGLGYVGDRYDNPSNAWAKWQARSPHWYDQGGPLPPGPTLAFNGTGRTEQVLTGEQIDKLARVADNAGITITKLEVNVRGILDPTDPAGYRSMVADIDEAITNYRKGYR